MGVCGDYGPLDFLNVCVRDSWSAFFPAAFVLALSIFSIPVPRRIRQALASDGAYFKPFLTLSEAEAFNAKVLVEDHTVDSDDPRRSLDTPKVIPRWRISVFVLIGVVECLSWAAIGAYRLNVHLDSFSVWRGACAVITAVSWIYTIIRPLGRLSTGLPYDLFILYTVFFAAGIIQLGGVLFDQFVLARSHSSVTVVGVAANLILTVTLLAVMLSTPVGYPSEEVDPKDIGVLVSSEDYITLWRWITFRWVYPLIKLGKRTTLREKDVWTLSATMQSRPVFEKFNIIYRSSLLRHLVAANALDILCDFLLTLATIVFNYGGPFFLKRILDAIDTKNATKESQAKAYTYAFLALTSALLKAQAEMQHLWFGRRAAIRLRQSLMAAIYDKALKRKDFSGIVKKDDSDKKKSSSPGGASGKGKTKAEKKADRKKADAADDPKAGADIGKIVNLMSNDTNRLAFTIAAINNMYGAPFEITIAGIFLYQLLGWSAFAGFSIMIVVWPMNTLLTRRRIRIHKTLLTARDKRMGVINELIGAIKLIKFFAWEERWIGKALDARQTELLMLIKVRINAVCLNFIWSIVPVMVAVISFYTYVMTGHQLTIGTAFTAIAVFNMVKSPVRIIPSAIVQLIQASVALRRIEVYLGEDEVDGQVSSLKRTYSATSASNEMEEGLGFENATLTWNSVTETEKNANGVKKSSPSSSSARTEDSVTLAGGSSDEDEDTPVARLFELKDLSVVFPEGELTVVTGPTASGKSALLMAVLGEMTLLSGRIIMSKEPSQVDEHGLMHSISYAAQTPWLRHQSIKDNILFGYPLDDDRYNEVIECCALRADLDIFEDGDATEIGAKGINLSGGQKARVALARAVYAHTKYVLLDDPLSAVDSHTARHLYERLLRGPLLAHRTVVLVTHHVDLVLPGTYYLIQMLDGRIDIQGAVKDLRSQGVLETVISHTSAEVHKEELIVAESIAVEGAKEDNSKPNEPTKKPRVLVKEEHREIGGVKWSVYKSYLKASSYWTWAVIAVFTVTVQLLNLGEKLWIKRWGNAYKSELNDFRVLDLVRDQAEALQSNGYVIVHSALDQIFTAAREWPSAAEHPLYYVGIYAAIGIASAVASNISGVTQYTGALRASRLLFGQLLTSVVRATFRFHDTTPQGRMLNRFGKDIEVIDSNLAASLQSVNSSMTGFFTSIITISVVFPYFLLPAIVIGYTYRELAIGYLNTGRDLRRMESNSRSPIYSDFAELLDGIVTVRAFSAERRFLNNLHNKLDVTTKMWYFFWMTNRWLLLNYDILGAVAVLITTLFSIATLKDDAGLAGLCITCAMAFTQSVYWACRNWTTLELDLNAVERIIEYLNLPQEPPAIVESNRVPAYWPSRSSSDSLLVVEDLEIRYAPELPAVLRDISFSLKAGERVGLLGRTGSGKSTLAMSILRFVNASSGRIIIDGIDISTIGTHDLRSRLTFIPQDATLFSGTLRENLNPFDEYDDAECLDALHRVHLMEPEVAASGDQSGLASADESDDTEGARTDDSRSTHTQVERDNKPTITLDTKVAAGGVNFSQGQRQLIAMARALLRRSSVIILDEATSSIDFATDAKIQTAIREQFNDSLLLTIAHRLRTVIDYDRLIVLDKGQVAEFDTPWKLINKEDGIFRNMCLKSGSFDELEKAAKLKEQLVA